MGQTLISKYQGIPPSRQEVDESLSDFLQTFHDRHFIWKLMATVLFKCSPMERAVDTLMVTIDRLSQQLKKTEVEVEDNDGEDWSRPPLPPLASTPPRELFFYQCKRCQIPAASSQFTMALPSRCNHPLCPRCLREDLTSGTYLEALIEVYWSTSRNSPPDFLHHALLCPVCGVVSDHLIFFEANFCRHLEQLYQAEATETSGTGGPHCWLSAKWENFALSICARHAWHCRQSIGSCLTSAGRGRGRRLLHFIGDQLIGEMDLRLSEWLTTAGRHYLQGLDCSGDKNNLKVLIGYLHSVATELEHPTTSVQGLQWLLTEWLRFSAGEASELEQEDNQQAKKEEAEMRCQLCRQLQPALWAMLDCCSHAHCSVCICVLATKDKQMLTCCPTCRRPLRKILFYGRFFGDGSKAKATLFRQIVCIDELLNEQVKAEQKVVEVVAVEKVEEEVLQAGGEVPAGEEEAESVGEGQSEDQNEKVGHRKGLKHRLAALWHLLTGCITKNGGEDDG